MTGTEVVDEGFSLRMKKGFYVVLGTLALAIGFIGLFLPVIPTTPLVLVAAACYMRGSKRLHGWLLESKWFGETIRTYQAGQGLRKATNVRAGGRASWTGGCMEHRMRHGPSRLKPVAR